MPEQRSSYRQIFKATSLFGGVQIIKILVTIIQSKVIAVLLGPAGMGIAGLLNTSIGLVGAITNFGLRTSAVRNISQAKREGKPSQISKVITVMRRLVIITGMLGLILTLVFAPFLSKLTFGSEEYTLAFRWLSVTLLIRQIASGQSVLLQGMRELKSLAKASVIGSILSLVVTIPLYYFYRIDGIVPVIIASSIVSMLIAWIFARRIKTTPVQVNLTDTIAEGKSMIILGFMLSLSGLMAVAASYIIRAFISHTGSLDDVGLYSAGFSIVGAYVGLIFSAMSTDFYPRLAEASEDNLKSKNIINQQAEIAILIIGPILCAFLIFCNWAVILLYSSKFTPINGMIQWAALGMYFKAMSWAIAFIFLAKGASKIYFWNELIANIYLLVLNIIGYKLYGLDGLGISFLLGYILYFLQVFFLTRSQYQFNLSKSLLKLFIIQILIGICCFIIVQNLKTPYSYFIGVIFILAASWHAFLELERKLDLKSIILKIRRKEH